MLDKLARRLLQPINTSVISILGVFNVLFGTWMLLPFSVLGIPAFMPEWAIGTITLGVGASIVLGSAKESYPLLATGCAMGSIAWIVGTVLSISIDWHTPAWIFSLMIALYCAFVYINISVNSKHLIAGKK